MVGGGIANEGTLFVSDCTISGKFASPRGGGIYNSSTGTLLLSNSIVTGNATTNAGGGLFNEGAITVSNCTFSGNGSTGADGGAVFNVGSLTIVTSTFSGNGGTGAYGGGVRNDGVVSVEESTFAGNTADLGGAFYNVGTLIINHSTLSSNMAGEGGGGIDSGGTLIAWNTILAGNRVEKGLSLDLEGVLTSRGHNLIGDTQGGSGFVSSDLLNVNPLLGPLQDNGGPTQTMALLPGSPAISDGDPTGAPAYDQRGPGFPRLVNGHIDVGAFEVQLDPSPRPRVGVPVDPIWGMPTANVTVAEQRLTVTDMVYPTSANSGGMTTNSGIPAPRVTNEAGSPSILSGRPSLRRVATGEDASAADQFFALLSKNDPEFGRLPNS
jgi:hypothetical protein